MTDRKLLPEADRLAVCAEIVERLKDRTQPQLGAELELSQNAISKAVLRDEAGPIIADRLEAKLGLTRAALRQKHADVVSGAKERPSETWRKMGRKRGSRTDLATVAQQLGIPPTAPPVISAATLAGARSIMASWDWPPAAIASAERGCVITVPTDDALEVATAWDSYLRSKRPAREQPQELAEAGGRAPKRSSRPATR